MMKCLFPLISMMLLIKSVYSMEHKPLHVFTIPGQRNYTGIDDEYVRSLFGQNIKNIKVPTPRITPDFGQDSCLIHLQNAIASQQNDFPSIIYARSQGTATALNYVGHVVHAKHAIKALVLEACLASGNSAICHTIAQSWPRISFLTELPLSYYWLPYLAKVLFWRYWPHGKQPITSLKAIPNDLPIIIVHAIGDRELPYKAACALYYDLRNQGNNNVYLISKDSSHHTKILEEEDKEVIRAILQKHEVPASNAKQTDTSSDIDLSRYQPKPDPFKNDYEALLCKEKNHARLGSGLTIAGVAGMCTAAYYALQATCQKEDS